MTRQKLLDWLAVGIVGAVIVGFVLLLLVAVVDFLVNLSAEQWREGLILGSAFGVLLIVMWAFRRVALVRDWDE